MAQETNEFEQKKEQVLSEVENYAKAEYKLARLRFVRIAGNLVGSVLLAICLILIAFAVLTFCAAAAVIALAQVIPAWAACLIIGAVYLLLIPVLMVCSKHLFVSPIVKKLSGCKDIRELEYETLRAEGQVAVQRERMNNHLRLVQVVYHQITNIAQVAWRVIRGLFIKK